MANNKTRGIIYWIATGLLSLGMFAGGMAQLAQVKFSADGIVHLGYPAYMMYIIGGWKIAGVITLLAPGFPLLKEWAYAGFLFLMTGAVISHIVSGDKPGQYLAPLLFACLTVVSWYARPANRRLNLHYNVD